MVLPCQLELLAYFLVLNLKLEKCNPVFRICIILSAIFQDIFVITSTSTTLEYNQVLKYSKKLDRLLSFINAKPELPQILVNQPSHSKGSGCSPLLLSNIDMKLVCTCSGN